MGINISLVMHHIGVAVQNIAEALPTYEDIFGYRRIAAPIHDPIQEVFVCFLKAAGNDGCLLELVAPAGPGSPVLKILAKGGSTYHICYEVVDLDSTLSKLRDNRFLIISRPVPAAAFDGRRIAWVYTPTRQLIELLESEKEVPH